MDAYNSASDWVLSHANCVAQTRSHDEPLSGMSAGVSVIVLMEYLMVARPLVMLAAGSVLSQRLSTPATSRAEIWEQGAHSTPDPKLDGGQWQFQL